MNIYHYDRATNQYLGTSVADVDPLKPGSYLMPALATTAQPPVTGANQAAIYQPATNDWTVVPDYRGHKYWLADRSEHTITELTVEPPIDALDALPAFTPSETAAHRVMYLNGACSIALSDILNKYPAAELATWPRQEQEARAYQLDPAAPIPFIDAVATARGITAAELVTRIITKADAYATTAAVAIGKRQALEDQIQSIVDDINLTDDEKRTAIAAVIW